jgi:hypothetical protein
MMVQHEGHLAGVRGPEPGHVRTDLSDDHLSDLLPNARNRLQQLDLVLPWLAGLADDIVELGQCQLD